MLEEDTYQESQEAWHDTNRVGSNRRLKRLIWALIAMPKSLDIIFPVREPTAFKKKNVLLMLTFYFKEY